MTYVMSCRDYGVPYGRRALLQPIDIREVAKDDGVLKTPSAILTRRIQLAAIFTVLLSKKIQNDATSLALHDQGLCLFQLVFISCGVSAQALGRSNLQVLPPLQVARSVAGVRYVSINECFYQKSSATSFNYA